MAETQTVPGKGLSYITEQFEKWRSNAQEPNIEEVVQVYDTFSKFYNETEYNGPAMMVEQVKPYIQDKTGLSVLDVGAGTGLVGVELRKLLRNPACIDALEPCQSMLEKAPTGTYDKLMFEFIEGLNSTTIPTGQYDLVCGAGVFAPCHVPAEGLYEMCRFAKIGALIVVAMRHQAVDGTWSEKYPALLPTVNKVEADGYCRIVKRIENFKGYLKGYNGTTYIFEKLKDF